MKGERQQSGQPEADRLKRRFACSEAIKGGGDGNRTRVQGFAGPCLSHSATPPQERASPAANQSRIAAPPSGRRDSNPRPSPWQGDALPAEPRPHSHWISPARVVNCSRSCRGHQLRPQGSAEKIIIRNGPMLTHLAPLLSHRSSPRRSARRNASRIRPAARVAASAVSARAAARLSGGWRYPCASSSPWSQ